MFEIHNSETGRTFVFASEDAYYEAESWYNRTSKRDQIAFCLERGLDLSETKNRLIADWAEAAMELYAQSAVHAP